MAIEQFQVLKPKDFISEQPILMPLSKAFSDSARASSVRARQAKAAATLAGGGAGPQGGSHGGGKVGQGVGKIGLVGNRNAAKDSTSASPGSFSEDQHTALRTYSESGSNYAASTTNSYLRKGKIVNEHNESVEQMDKHIAAIDGAMRATPTTEERVLFRGTGLGEFGLNSRKLGDPQSLVGKVLTDKGYTSTSTDKSMVENAYSSDGGALLKITVPKGTPHVDMNAERGYGKVAHVEGEKEVLLPRGSSFKVKSVSVTPGARSWHPPVTTVEVELVSTPQKKGV